MILRRTLIALPATFIGARAFGQTVYYDYVFKFPVTGLASALQGMAALQASGLLDGANLPQNMLGDPRDVNGNVITDGSVPAWIGRPGPAASSYTDPSGATVQIPQKGDPTQYYVWIHASLAPSALTVDPTTYGLVVCDQAEAAQVLGVWA